jgi:hypothetical protein
MALAILCGRGPRRAAAGGAAGRGAASCTGPPGCLPPCPGPLLPRIGGASVPAIRLTEAHEHYDRQHQLPRTEAGRSYGDDLAHLDARYLARLTRAMAAAVGALSAAPAAPREVALGGAVSPDTTLRIALPADPRVAGLVLYRRRADAVEWQRVEAYPRTERIVLPGLVIDNHAFAVATVDAEGNESLPAAPGRLE